MQEIVFLSVLSDLFVNLAAGWLGAVFIAPNFSSEKKSKVWLVLIVDLVSAILCLLVALFLKGLS